MLRCEHCGAYIPEKGVFCPRCGEKVTPLEGKRKTAVRKWFGRMLGKFFALLLYLVLSAVHMVVIFVGKCDPLFRIQFRLYVPAPYRSRSLREIGVYEGWFTGFYPGLKASLEDCFWKY